MVLMELPILDNRHKTALEKARKTYGFRKQMSVVGEELSELSILCDKYQRFDSDERAIQVLRDRTLEETADVLIVLDHIIKIFQITEEDLKPWIDVKVERLKRWMNDSNSLEQSTIDRSLDGETE